jgi:hypothetical protein
MRPRRIWFGLTAALLVTVAAVALAAGAKSFNGSATYKVTNDGKSNAKTGERTGVAGKGVFSGKLSVESRSLLAAYAAAAHIPLGDVLEGGRYAVSWSSRKGKIHGTALAKFRAGGAGSVCISYTSTQTTFDADFKVKPPHGTFKTIGGTGKGARTRVSGTFDVGEEKYHGKEDRTDTLFGTIKSEAAASRPLSAACKKLAKAAG